MLTWYFLRATSPIVNFSSKENMFPTPNCCIKCLISDFKHQNSLCEKSIYKERFANENFLLMRMDTVILLRANLRPRLCGSRLNISTVKTDCFNSGHMAWPGQVKKLNSVEDPEPLAKFRLTGRFHC